MVLSDLTEDEAKIESNRDAIAHIQEKDVQQDGRLDKLEECCEQAKAHFTQLDTKTDNTNTALAAEIDRAKAAELANGKLIAKNAAELANHATQLADHEQRISALESDNTTSKQDIADIKAKNAQQDTAISGNTDSITHLETDKADKTALGDYVTKTAFNTDQKRQDDVVGDWATAHPGQTISECATSQENELAEHAGELTRLETDKADKSEIPDVTGYVPTSTYNDGQAAQDARITALEKNSTSFPASVRYTHVDIATVWAENDERSGNFASVILPFPFKTFTEHPESATISDVSIGYAEVLYLDGSPMYQITHSDVTLSAEFVGAGVRLTATVPMSGLPSDIETKSHILHFVVMATIS